MRLRSVQVQNFRSIIDSSEFDLDPNITALVGMTGSGKTSLLRMLAGLDPNIIFQETELPNGSDVKQKFSNGELPSSKIPQLRVKFKVEQSDQQLVPTEFQGVDEIEIRRFFDGHFEVNTTKGTVPEGAINLEENLTRIRGTIEGLKNSFTNAQGRVGALAPLREGFFKSSDQFLQTNFSNLKELDLSIRTLTNTTNGLPKDGQFANEVVQRLKELSTERDTIAKALEQDPVKRLIAVTPKPAYKSEVMELTDKVSLDDFISKPESSRTFSLVAIVSGLKPSGVQKIRNTTKAEQDSYFDVISKNLSEQLNNFWGQEKYDFKIGIDRNQLSFTVSDRTTHKATSVLEGSDGFKWWTAFFLEMAADLSNKPSTNIVLLDNPATSLHDEGKADVLRFLVNTVNSGRLQVVYSTHERALIDPWRLDRIRVVEKRQDGTQVEEIRGDSRTDLLEKIRRNIGLPARYSLFGAPRTVAFEGISDLNLVSAFNEYLEQKGQSHLNKDSYSINACNGLGSVPDHYRPFRGVGIDFVFVVDSGSDTTRILGRIDDDDSGKHIIEINEITGKDGDIEDLVDPRVYHTAFSRAYTGTISQIPDYDAINGRLRGRKTVNRYSDWFRSNNLEFNKTLVAQEMFSLLMRSPESDLPREALDNSANNFTKLFELVRKHFET